jgi:hypothetical protein
MEILETPTFLGEPYTRNFKPYQPYPLLLTQDERMLNLKKIDY